MAVPASPAVPVAQVVDPEVTQARLPVRLPQVGKVMLVVALAPVMLLVVVVVRVQ